MCVCVFVCVHDACGCACTCVCMCVNSTHKIMLFKISDCLGVSMIKYPRRLEPSTYKHCSDIQQWPLVNDLQRIV